MDQEKINKLNEDYKKSCKQETKKNINEAINFFIDDETIDDNYKQNIINMIICLLTLQK